jgi:hypothetical protein
MRMRKSPLNSTTLLTSLFVLSLTLAMPSVAFAQGTPAPKPAAGDAKAAPAAGDAKAGDAKAGDAKAGDAGDAKPAAAAPAAPAAAPADGGGDSRVRLKALEQRVNELKERIFRSKARLNLLKETVLHGVIAGSRAIIRHKNEMGSSFRMTKLSYAVDGAQIYSSSNETKLNEQREFDVYNGSIVPRSHTISVVMQFRGHGYGIFTYLKGYKFTVRSSYSFTATEGRQNQIVVRAFERGNATTELKDRPAVKFVPSIFKVGTKKAIDEGDKKGDAKKGDQ